MADTPPPVSLTVSPEPTDDELAAILAAYCELWPTPTASAAKPPPSPWKYSGRWWHTHPRRPTAGATWR